MNPTQPQPNKFTYPLEIRGVETDVLFSTPDGWLQTNIKYARSKMHGGVIRALTLPIEYVKTGAMLVRREVYKYGLLARLNQRILINDPLTYTDSTLFFGKLDISKFSDSPTGVTINLKENNINNQIAAYADQQYSIPLEVNQTQRTAWINSRGYDPMVDIMLTPLQLEETADMIFSTTPDFRMNAFFQLEIGNYQQMSLNASVKPTGFLQQGSPVFAGNPNYFFVAQADTKIRISSPLDPITGLPTPNSISTSINGEAGSTPAIYQFNIYDQAGTLLKTLAQSPSVTMTVSFTFSFDFSLSVTAGTQLFFYIKNILDPTGNPGTTHGVNMQNGTMRLTYFTETSATHCKALRGAYVLDNLIQQMNGTDNPAVTTQSRLLETDLFPACITCSNAILTSQQTNIYQAGENLQIGDTYRVLGGVIHYVDTRGHATDYAPGQIFKAIIGFSTFTNDMATDGFVQQQDNNPQILISYNAFFKSYYGVQGGQLGAGLDPTAPGAPYCFEDLRYFFRPTGKSAGPNQAAIDLGVNIDVNSPIVKMAEDFIVNSISAGYSNPQLTALNGSKEVNAGVKYGTKITTTSNVLDLVSPINASPYVIEEKRIQPGNNNPSNGLTGSFYLNSAASRSDNDNHFVWVKDAPEIGQTYYQPLTVADGCQSYSGVDAGYYNWKLSPMQNVLRGSNYLASIFYNMGGYTIYITGADKNTSMITVDLNGRRVSESDDIQISNLANPIFLPWYSTVVTGLPINAEQMLSLNPFSEVWYQYLGLNWKMFIGEVSVDCGSNTAQSFKGLFTPGTDLGMRVF